MNQKEKLIELLKIICECPEETCPRKDSWFSPEDCIDCPYEIKPSDDEKLRCDDFPRIADYLLANGVIVLPCKVGDMVYVVCPVQGITEQKVKRFQLGSYGLMFATGKGVRPVDDFGKTVFLTREEAEKALREREDNA